MDTPASGAGADSAKKLRVTPPGGGTRGRGGRPGRPPGGRGQGGSQGRRMGRGMMGRAARAAAAAQTVASTSGEGAAGPSKEDGVELPGMPGAGADPDDTFAGTFAKELPMMLYGFGDDESPLQETVEAVEAALLQYLGTVAGRAVEAAAVGLRTKPDERDVMFVVRKDPAKFTRIKELLVVQQVIKDLRRTTKDAK